MLHASSHKLFQEIHQTLERDRYIWRVDNF